MLFVKRLCRTEFFEADHKTLAKSQKNVVFGQKPKVFIHVEILYFVLFSGSNFHCSPFAVKFFLGAQKLRHPTVAEVG